MAEGDATVMNNFKEQLLLKTIDCNSDTFKINSNIQPIGE